jgi:pimeloyl-ACP methyl ester carboxylesterase
MQQLMFPANPNFWFETVRSFSHIAAGGAEFGEVLATAAAITGGDTESWHDRWLATADRVAAVADEARSRGHEVTARDAALRASNYYRSAEFFLHDHPDDPRILHAYRRGVEQYTAYADSVGAAVLARVSIPWDGAVDLPGWFHASPLPGPRPVVVMHSGFDGGAEECHFFGARAGVERGYHVLAFDGPGQPGTRQEHGVVFRPDWENVIAPVIDWLVARDDVDPDRIALWGISLGGQLAFRAAAFEPRLAAVIADDGVYDFGDLPAGMLGLTRQQLEAEARAESAPRLDAHIDRAMAENQEIHWALTHGRYVMGGDTYRETVARMLDYNLRDGVAAKITCPALVCDAENDFATGQSTRVMDDLNVSHRALRRFTAEEGADLHCHLGATGYAAAVILDWLSEVLNN